MRRHARGESLQSIADDFDVSKQYIARLLFDGKNRTIYPNLNTWMRFNQCSLRLMADDIDTDTETLQYYLSKNTTPKWMIDKILSLTGLSYDVAFKENDTQCKT